MVKGAKVKYENPVVQYHKNMVLTNLGHVWSYFKIKPESLNLANADNKKAFKDTFIDVFEVLQGYQDIDLKLIPKDMDLAGRIRGTSSEWAKDLNDVAQYYIGQEEVNILQSEFDPAIEDTFYIGVRLNTMAVGDELKDKVEFGFNLFLRRLAEMARFEAKAGEDFFKAFEPLNDRLLSNLSALNAQVLSSEELADLLGFAYHHQGVPDFKNMRDTVFDLSHTRYIQRDTIDKTDYFTNLVVNLPDNLSRLELLPELQSYKFPVEVHIKINYPPKDGILGIRGDTKASLVRFSEEVRDGLTTDIGSSRRTETNLDLTTNLNDVLDDNKGFMNWCVTLVIRDNDLKTLRHKVNEVRARINDFNREIKVFQPSFNQEMLFYQTLPASRLGVFKEWRQYTSVPALAELLFGTTQTLGSRAGFYVGRVLDLKQYDNAEQAIASSRLLLLLNLISASKGGANAKTSSPHISITGDMGGGKSFLVKLLMLHLAMFDTKLLYIDPKQEVKRWFMRALETEKNTYFQKLLNSFHYVTLNANDERNKGLLDPILTLNEHSSQAEIPSVKTLVLEMIAQLRSFTQDMELDTLLRSKTTELCQRRINGEKVGTLTLLDMLMATENEKAISFARNLREVMTGSMVLLAFSDGSTDSIQFNDRRTILEITGLQLPESGQDISSYTETQRYSIAIMLSLGKYLEKFGRENPDEYSCEIIDEAWIFTKSEAGRVIFKGIRRMGRSENNALIYTTQRISDIDNEESDGQYGQIFAFDSQDVRERERILRYFNLPVSDSNLKMLESMKKGQCLFRDVYGRTGKIGIHSLFDEWTTAFKTNNDNASLRLEEKYG
ncbi:ATP-binding protein [Leuconostoc pseudomesenteroides]|uniref:ATP-binding protein n=1 Tax=Leuconostoc pseudomesenteroides TaxID=33968 RepID=UPI0032DFC1A1